jgi:CBS domain-containing protein
VREVMTAEVVTVAPEATMQVCRQLMTERRIRHLPVVRDGALLGIVSIRDVVEATLAEQAFLIEQLQGYIQGTV